MMLLSHLLLLLRLNDSRLNLLQLHILLSEHRGVVSLMSLMRLGRRHLSRKRNDGSPGGNLQLLTSSGGKTFLSDAGGRETL